MDKGNPSYGGTKWRPCFDEVLIQSSSESLRPTALESSELPTKEFRRQIPVKVKEVAALERNSNFGTFNLHEFAMPLRRRTTPKVAQVRLPHFTKAQLRIELRTRCGSAKLQKQPWDERKKFY